MGPKIQDIQNIVNVAQNRILQQMPIRQDIVTISNNVKTLITLIQQNQQLLRQNELQVMQLIRRSSALEARLVQLEQEAKTNRSVITRSMERQAQPQTFVLSQDQEDERQYVYRPA